MEELDDLRRSVERRLTEMGIDPLHQDERTLKQLEAIQAAVEGEAERISEARRVAAHGMPIVRVAELSGVSRQTFYNKPLLMEYSEKAIREAGIEEGREVEARLRTLVAEHEEAIASFVKRDGELVEAQIKLRDAKQEIVGLRASLAEAKGTIASLRKTLDEANRRKTPAKVIKMR